MVVADCRWSFQTDFLAPSMFLTLPHPGHGYKWCPDSCLAPALSYFPLPQSPKCLAYIFYLPGMGSMGMQWAQELISDWCNRVLNLTSWAGHALNINKARAFWWTCGVHWEHLRGDQPAVQARCDLCKNPLKYSADLLCAAPTLLKKFPSVLNCLQQQKFMKKWKVKNSLWLFRKGSIGKFGGVGQAFRWHPFLTSFWPYLLKEIEFEQRK